MIRGALSLGRQGLSERTNSFEVVCQRLPCGSGLGADRGTCQVLRAEGWALKCPFRYLGQVTEELWVSPEQNDRALRPLHVTPCERRGHVQGRQVPSEVCVSLGSSELLRWFPLSTVCTVSWHRPQSQRQPRRRPSEQGDLTQDLRRPPKPEQFHGLWGQLDRPSHWAWTQSRQGQQALNGTVLCDMALP